MPTRQTGALGGFVADAATATSNIVAESRAGSADEGASQENSGADALQNVNGATAIAPTMVIRNGQAFIEVNNVDSAIFRIRRLTAQVGGYITNSSISGGRDQIRQATLELKIPALKYDEAVGSLSVIGKVETVNSTAQDVGEEFVDVTARMNNARRLEDRLITLLATRTGKLDEVLRVEHELARVREEIERYQGRLRYLSSRAAISTLTITVHEPVAILGNNPGENPISAALNRAWRNFVALFAGLIASLGVVLPLALIAFAGWMGYRRWKRR
jgi:VIT1/CCC1 family predicted Fe2+/Mn2+ transporter